MSDDFETLQLAYAATLRDPERFRRESHWLRTTERLHICEGYALCERCGYTLQPGTEMVAVAGQWWCARCYGEKSQ